MDGDLISRSALIKELDGTKQPSIDTGGTVKAEPVLNLLIELTKCVVESVPAVDAVPVEMLGKWGKLFIPYKGCPRGPVGRMGAPATLEEEALYWGVITDVDGGRWVPVQEDVLRELIEKAKEQNVVRCCECKFQDTCKRIVEIIPRKGETGSLGGRLHSCKYGERRGDDQ